MEACDLRGKTISVGSYARYSGTGTTGQVSDIKEENNNKWAKFNDSDLWYSLDTIELINKEDIKNFNNKDKDTDKVKKLKEDAENDAVSNFSDVDACGAG